MVGLIYVTPTKEPRNQGTGLIFTNYVNSTLRKKKPAFFVGATKLYDVQLSFPSKLEMSNSSEDEGSASSERSRSPRSDSTLQRGRPKEGSKLPIRYTFVETAGSRQGAVPGNCKCCPKGQRSTLDNWQEKQVSTQRTQFEKYFTSPRE